eukprot:gene2373-biopygen8907
MDGLGQVAGVGTPGELWVGGECLARGYLNLGHKTSDVFDTSCADVYSGRLYRTGDLCRRLA